MSQIVHDPSRRQRYRFHRADDEALQVEVWASPGANVPAHVHPAQEERFQVLSGTVTFWVDGRRTNATAGATVVAPPGSVHAFLNDDGEAHLMAEVRPALDLQEFLESAAGLARAGRITARGVPKGPRALLQVAVLARHFEPCTYLARPPLRVQRALLRPLARVARLFGYRAPGVIAAARSVP
jgi:quercetin dioxygenase-like cupin family protein